MPAGDLVVNDYTLELGGTLLGDGTVYELSYEKGGITGLGVPQPKTNDTDLAHAKGRYAGRDYTAERLITIPFVITGATATATGDSFEVLAGLFAASTVNVPLFIQLPGLGKFKVDGRPRGLTEDLRNLQYGWVEALGYFWCGDPALRYETARTVTNKALTSNVATLTTSVAHGFVIGQPVTVAGVDATFNGTYTITSTPTTTTFTYAKTAANVTSVASGGTATSFV